MDQRHGHPRDDSPLGGIVTGYFFIETICSLIVAILDLF